MDQQWAADRLERFVSAIDTQMELERVGHLVVDSERQTLKLGQDADAVDNTIRALVSHN